jgi:hypothetical protein
LFLGREICRPFELVISELPARDPCPDHSALAFVQMPPLQVLAVPTPADRLPSQG